MTRQRFEGVWLLAAMGCLAATAQAIEAPAGWDLTFAAQRAEAPPVRRGWNDTFNPIPNNRLAPRGNGR
jgi:hypothetical protein